ncbi:fimbria/pilus outer membrane usher protein [Kluyvera intermedia]|uniref:fimbria/pilus outer membrane usher protein n=1 Tax=Kluyvera intermedia TaxID=61648 RepID=UPI0035A23F56
MFQRSVLSVCIFMLIQGIPFSVSSVDFNTDIMDAEDRSNIDLSRFSQAGYIMPGEYQLSMVLNGQKISEQHIVFRERKTTVPDKKAVVETCLTRDQVNMLGLKPDALEKIAFDKDELCGDFSAIEGVVLRGDLSTTSLHIAIPQSWLEYQDASWLPPSRWENGIPGLLLDYNVNATHNRPNKGNPSQNVSASGTTGANLGAWRLRGDWQGNYSHTTGQPGSLRTFDWSRIYAYRALPGLMAKMTVGEDYLSSDLFDSWRYTGASLVSDESQLPPKLRGYAPEVSGIARTNAKVIISQQGRVIYESTVAAGPFRIQELGSATSGTLDVRVEEQDGTVQTFQTTTATIPYLTRPGQVRYKLAVGRPSDYSHHVEGPMFGTAELSWGVSNAWSLYGGGIFSQDYNSVALGIGRDLFQFGAISTDITQSVARYPGDTTLSGRSYRVSYSKRFEEFNGDVTFAGYRFSERNYLSMTEYLNSRYHNGSRGNSKELYTVTASKSFPDQRISTSLSWSHQTYWDRVNDDRYSLSASTYFDAGDWRNVALSLSASRSEYEGRTDDAVWLSLSLPLGNGTASYNGNWNKNKSFTQSASWYQRLKEGDSYRLSAGTRNNQGESMTTQASGLYSHYGAMGDITANVGWQQNAYSSFGLSFSGGMTATAEGAALHGASPRGGTRMLVSTDGISGVPVGRNGKNNFFGIAVEPSVPSYYRASTRIDVNRLPDDVEVGGTPVAEAALTEGAIGFRRFDVLKGSKVVAILAMADGSHPPFGASVRNAKERELGMVSDGGLAWITGVNPGESLGVYWGGKQQCVATLPSSLTGISGQLLLPCRAEISL